MCLLYNVRCSLQNPLKLTRVYGMSAGLLRRKGSRFLPPPPLMHLNVRSKEEVEVEDGDQSTFARKFAESA